jgi:hypothetical protein
MTSASSYLHAVVHEEEQAPLSFRFATKLGFFSQNNLFPTLIYEISEHELTVGE